MCSRRSTRPIGFSRTPGRVPSPPGAAILWERWMLWSEWLCPSPRPKKKKSIFESLTPSVMAAEGGAFEKSSGWLRSWACSPWDGVCTLVRGEETRAQLSLPQEDTMGSWPLQSSKRTFPSPRPHPCSHPDLSLPELWEMNVGCLSH